MVDDPACHEQRGLERGVIDRMEDRRHRSQRTAKAQEQGDQAEMADRRIREQSFQILLEDRGPGPDQQRGKPCRSDQEIPLICAGQYRPQAHKNERSEEHTSELQSLMRISYAVFILKKK